MAWMIHDSAFSQDISQWDVSNVKECDNFFNNLESSFRPNFENCSP